MRSVRRYAAYIAVITVFPILAAGTNLNAAAPAAQAIDASHVRLLPGSPFFDRQELHRAKYLASWDPDRLLYYYRQLAGLPQADGATRPYPGWEGGFVRGHMAGHYLSAASRMYAATGDQRYRDRANYIVAELGKCQAAINRDGYLAGFPVSVFDQLERDELDLHGVLVPYYTVHKIMAGLLDSHRYLENQQALEIVVRMANYFQKRIESLTADRIERIFRTDAEPNPTNEFGGMGDTLVDLATVTGESRYLRLAAKFNRPWFIKPLAVGEDHLAGLHANTHVAQVLGFANYSQVTGDNESQMASRHFWDLVTSRHSFVNGGNGFREWLDKPGIETGPSIDGGKSLPATTSESCGTYNMLKLTARLFEHEPRIEYADYFEIALYNHILAAMDPDTGAVTYFAPMHGDFRTYLTGTFCCVASSLEYTPRFNEGIYFKSVDRLWVNLYIPSSVEWDEQQITLAESGDVASGAETASFTVTQCGSTKPLTLNFRVPYWIAAPAVLSVNGEELSRSIKPSTYLSATRVWQEGDTITLLLPRALRLERAKDSASMVSIFYGPLLLAGELGRDRMPNDVGDKDANLNESPATVPSIVSSSSDPNDWVESEAISRQVFRLKQVGPASGIKLRPLYELHHQRYSVYWPLRLHDRAVE